MNTYKAYMPVGKRVYSAYMPAGKRVYNVWMQFNEFIRSPCTLVPYGSAEAYNSWFSLAANPVTVVENGDQWDITDNSTQYGVLKQVSVVVEAQTQNELHHVQVIVNKETVDDHFLIIQMVQFETYSLAGGNTAVGNVSSAFNLVTGADDKLINPGGITNYVEDLGTKWRFVLEFNRNQTALYLVSQIYPAGGTSFSSQDPAATGTITVDCIQGYIYGYTP